MKMKIITGIVVLAVITLISGATILATAAPGTTQQDPFITLDYLTNNFKPQILIEIRNAEQELTRAFDAKLADLEARFYANQSVVSQTPGSADRFSVVTLNRGQSLTCSVGAEIMLRLGTANGFGSAPALVNYTTGDALSPGSALTANNMYLVTIEGNGVRATADSVKVLVRGNYRISNN